MAELQSYLDAGDLVPVREGDDITAGGLEEWEDDPPKYHSFDFETYVHFDLKEWIGRVKTYKREFVRHAERSRKLSREVEDLRKQVDLKSSGYEDLESAIQDAIGTRNELTESIKEATNKRDELQKDIMVLKQHSENSKKAVKNAANEANAYDLQVALMNGEIENDLKQHKRSFAERGKLHLERKWFNAERVLLEETTNQEDADKEALREAVEKLRHVMHKAWKEPKERDILGLLRSTKMTPNDEEWFAARRRNFIRTAGGSRYMRAETVEVAAE